ncbi:MAG: hypothetical protein HOE92_04525 [Euryarchaeota archaeon]|jgi:chaperonin cofactor prefoldin|nr:hypothetical protein [Euryarchaeota archaeon]MBT3971465.1 hypothetical protein [Euryarchaeota archaeon]MBT4407447.1 hypothetical protein [Euryarchaeota archaeon]MBT6644584.1 hypothetical protein [Euryarchaeota archaeon]
MAKSFAVLFSIIIIGASLGSCISEDRYKDDYEEQIIEAEISDLENQIRLHQNKIEELSNALNYSAENLTFQHQENLSSIQNLSTQIEQLVLQISELELAIEELESLLRAISEDSSPKLLVITVDVEAGNRCGELVSNNLTHNRISTCMYGAFGDQRAGIIEMMDIADEVGAKISFFVDVMEYYTYGDQMLQVMRDIDSRGHDVQLHFHPSMINSTNWEIIQNSEEWNESEATKDTYMNCWDQNTANFWFSNAMKIFDETNITRPVAYRSGAYRYCDTIIQAMANNNMTQSYNYNIFSSGRQNYSAGYLYNFQWENGVFEFPITYVKDQDGELRMSSRIDDSTWTLPANDIFERYYGNHPSTRVMTMILHSYSFLDTNEAGQYYLKDQSKVNDFRAFMLKLSDEYTIVSSSELQAYIADGSVRAVQKFPLSFLENECNR